RRRAAPPPCADAARIRSFACEPPYEDRTEMLPLADLQAALLHQLQAGGEGGGGGGAALEAGAKLGRQESLEARPIGHAAEQAAEPTDRLLDGEGRRRRHAELGDVGPADL